MKQKLGTEQHLVFMSSLCWVYTLFSHNHENKLDGGPYDTFEQNRNAKESKC